MRYPVLLFAFITLLVSCGSPARKDKETLVDSTTQVANTAPDASTSKVQGYIMPGLDHGFEQSPINIVSTANTEGKHAITLYFKDEVNKVENLGHTVQLDFQEGSVIVQDDTTFAFKQCHFHTPSEHLIDGMTFPMEMHVVNIMPNQDPKATPQYLVVGVLFKLGKENPFINDFLAAIPKEENTATKVKAGSVRLHDLFGLIPNEVNGNYYNYRGSLTTPPYTESVRWYIGKRIFEASAEQIEAINKIEGNNARHVQALYGRKISTK